MRKITDELEDIVNSNSLIKFGLHERLLNLSKLAEFLKPIIEARTKKEIKSSSALVMALSRLQRQKINDLPEIKKFKVFNLSIKSDLATISFSKTNNVLQKMDQIQLLAQKNNQYLTQTQGINEVTLICDQALVDGIKKIINEKEKNFSSDLGALGIHYDDEYFNTPGLLYFLIQQVFFQGINIREIISTYTEIIIYVDQKDIKLLFDTIYTQFSE